MYKAFFHLRSNPFEIPNPHFLFPTLRHSEALANLSYAIRACKGLVVLTGEAGTGKTLLVRCLLEKLAQHCVRYIYVFNPLLGPKGFLRYVAVSLGLQGEWKDKSELLIRLHEYLIWLHGEALATVLVVDEAHLLSREVLEEIRLLSNLETYRNKAPANLPGWAA